MLAAQLHGEGVGSGTIALTHEGFESTSPDGRLRHSMEGRENSDVDIATLDRRKRPQPEGQPGRREERGQMGAGKKSHGLEQAFRRQLRRQSPPTVTDSGRESERESVREQVDTGSTKLRAELKRLLHRLCLAPAR